MKKKREKVIYKSPKKKNNSRKKTRARPAKVWAFSLLMVSYRDLVRRRLGVLAQKACGLAALVCFLLVGTLGLILHFNQEFAAGFADNLLRPVIGTKATILIESYYFNFQDGVNRFKYSFNKKKAPAVVRRVAVKAASESAMFDLSPISPLNPEASRSGEGIWMPISIGSGAAMMARTFYKPDPERPYAEVALVKLNMNKLGLSAVAGTTDPGGSENPGPGKIPDDIRSRDVLVAAFNGGFLGKDGGYGMIVGKKVYTALQKDLATVILRKNQNPEIIEYKGEKLKGDIMAVRQNGPLLIEDRVVVATSSAWDMQKWGLTITNDMYTWRSGIGVTKNGNLIYACGPSLIPETLARALKEAGAVNAMQLDINPFWVRFYTYESLGKGDYKSTPLLSDINNSGEQYLSGFRKDFFYAYKK